MWTPVLKNGLGVTVRNDVAHTGSDVAALEYDLAAVGQQFISIGNLAHGRYTTSVHSIRSSNRVAYSISHSIFRNCGESRYALVVPKVLNDFDS
jgi:hypothetical protein